MRKRPPPYFPEKSATKSILRDPLFQLFVLIVVVIIYGSLYPFRFFDTRDLPWRIDELLNPSLGQNRGDDLGNIVLFVPLGVLGTSLLRRYRSDGTWRSVFAVFVFGTFLGVILQIGQLFVRGRVPALSDAFWNSIGTLAGSAMGVMSTRVSRFSILTRDSALPQLAAFPMLLAASWLAYRLVPFVPTLDWQSIKDNLKPLLLHPELHLVDVLRNSAGWLLFAAVWETLGKPRLRNLHLALFVPMVFAAEVLIENNAVTAANVVGAALALTTWWGVRRESWRHALAALWLGGTIAAMELEGFSFRNPQGAFYWLPFFGFLGGNLLVDVQQLLLKFFFYAGQIFLLVRLRWKLWQATILTVSGLFVLEYCQRWIPARTPEITDPLLALLSAGLLRALDSKPDGARDDEEAYRSVGR